MLFMAPYLVGFTSISGQIPVLTLIEELSRIFTEFDRILEKNQCIRIKTIEDGYMEACGVDQQSEHATSMVKAGLDMIHYIETKWEGLTWKCRVGINTGKVISGVVGKQRFQFDLMGDAVNVASRIESNAPPMQLCVSLETSNLLNKNDFEIISLGSREIKGKGNLEIFSINPKS